MSQALIVALIGGAAVVAASVIGAAATVAVALWRRMLRAESTNDALWTYTRMLIDHIYRGAAPPPPPPPDHIAHIYDPGDST